MLPVYIILFKCYHKFSLNIRITLTYQQQWKMFLFFKYTKQRRHVSKYLHYNFLLLTCGVKYRNRETCPRGPKKVSKSVHYYCALRIQVAKYLRTLICISRKPLKIRCKTEEIGALSESAIPISLAKLWKITLYEYTPIYVRYLR